VPFEEDDKDPSIWFLDHSYLEVMFRMFKKVNGEQQQQQQQGWLPQQQWLQQCCRSSCDGISSYVIAGLSSGKSGTVALANATA
jgi:hypothetical protein